MPKFKEGDRVQVRAREVQGKEAQEGRYAPHLANATGAILKIYSPQEIAVDLDLDSLPEAIRERHAEQQTRMHERWLNSLSEEARNRLTDDEKTFRLRYVALLAEDDLLPLKGGRTPTSALKAESEKKAVPQSSGTSKAAERVKAEAAQTAESKVGGASAKAKPTAKPAPQAQPEPSTSRRPTQAELDELEEQYLKSRKRRGS
ncbi:MAG: hypothetical protein N2554_00140 [Fimbriimonadales bacterium]|nr:hypothetical protein [Fimbriimonadales bacterium]